MTTRGSTSSRRTSSTSPGSTRRPQRKPLFAGALPPRRPFGEVIDGAVVVPKGANLFPARTASLREVGWDDRLRLVEHRDFFTRASGRPVCVQADGVRAYHVRTPYAATYMRYRQHTAEAMSCLE